MSEQGPRFPAEFNLADYYLFDRLEEGLGDRVAVRFGELSYTYSEIAERAGAFANYLQQAGVASEQRVYVVLPDVPAFAWTFFGTLAQGAVVAMGNPLAPPDDLAYVLRYSRARVLVTTPSVVEALGERLGGCLDLDSVLLVPDTPTGGDCEAGGGTIAKAEALCTLNQTECLPLADALARERRRAFDPPRVMRDDVAIWLFTSGSTGRAKAAVHTHRDFAFNTEVYAKETLGYRRDDVTVSVSKLFFGYATGTNLMFPFSVGATTCLFSERCTAEALMKAIEMYRPTIVTNVPTMMAKLLDHDEERGARDEPPLDLSSVRFHLSAGEALPPPLLDRFVARFNAEVYDGIGSAEMFHIYVTNRPGDVRPGSLGRPVRGYQIALLPADAVAPGVEPVATGDVGVLWVRGDSVAQCYFQDRDKSWATFHGHWCRTGDLFRMDEDGYLWFEGRADSLFKVGGVWVSPLEIEHCLSEHEAVAMAAVIPIKRDGLTKPGALVVLREHATGLDQDLQRGELQDFVRSRLSKHKYPRSLVFVENLPKNDRGKVDRKVLQERDEKGDIAWT